jgi:hypothetical protein
MKYSLEPMVDGWHALLVECPECGKPHSHTVSSGNVGRGFRVEFACFEDSRFLGANPRLTAGSYHLFTVTHYGDGETPSFIGLEAKP